ncbi:MAG: hypothetical protein QNJ63_19290 [Calothrix sp. MO_192.B10]|nr:hypothetical protein [Calothrix sp. MO_192.B10]
MHFLINEQSFIGQAENNYDADHLMQVLFEIIKELEPIQYSKPILIHSSFFDCQISNSIKLRDWLHSKYESSSGEEQEKIRILLIKLMNKGPFIDELLDEKLEFHECHFNGRDVSGSSLAGAAHLINREELGNLISLQNAPEFAADCIQVKFSTDGASYQDIEISNFTDVSQAKKLRPRYVPSPKHAKGGWGTFMDLSDEIAQEVLDRGIVNGRQIYGYYDEKFYEFQSDNAGGFHGYPVDQNEVPPKIIEDLKQINN